jgi:hypothetical protein
MCFASMGVLRVDRRMTLIFGTAIGTELFPSGMALGGWTRCSTGMIRNVNLGREHRVACDLREML